MSYHNRETSLPPLNKHLTAQRNDLSIESHSFSPKVASTFLHQRVDEIMRKAILPAPPLYKHRPKIKQILRKSKALPFQSTKKQKIVPQKVNFVPINGTRKTLSDKQRNIRKSFKRPRLEYSDGVCTQESKDLADEELESFHFTERVQNRVTIFSKLCKPFPNQQSSGNSLSRDSLENYYNL